MAGNKMVVGILGLILLLVGLMCVFTVKETELALMLRFGKVNFDRKGSFFCC